MSEDLDRMRARAGIVEMATNEGSKITQIVAQALIQAGYQPQQFPSMGHGVIHITSAVGTQITINVREEHQ